MILLRLTRSSSSLSACEEFLLDPAAGNLAVPVLGSMSMGPPKVPEGARCSSDAGVAVAAIIKLAIRVA